MQTGKPDLAQGGAQAIEDAASLAAMLPRGGVDVAEIPDRLRLYEQCRCERVAAVQEYTRQSGCDRDHSVNDSTRLLPIAPTRCTAGLR